MTVLTRALGEAQETYGSAHRHTNAIRAGLACCHALSGQLMAAAAALDHAIADSTALLGADHPDTAELLADREELLAHRAPPAPVAPPLATGPS